ncbi:hypothetical protein D915_010451 [Fasciola hepatica]|uniref:Uncharacterized protein n=1 Tax=Fasciola hepatica TaxID=6192 RepID=A0A4E0QU86_FASHE|nr:hypothetical protein D915_010451 [Fasciola hepatica]
MFPGLLVTVRILQSENLMIRSPLLHYCPRSYFPRMCLTDWVEAPVLVFQSPSTRRMSRFGTPFEVCCRTRSLSPPQLPPSGQGSDNRFVQGWGAKMS